MDELDWSKVDITSYLKNEKTKYEQQYSTLHNPDILNISIIVNPICTNVSCMAKVDVVSDTLVVCSHCSRKMKLKKCLYTLQGTMDVKIQEKEIALKFDQKLLNKFYGLDVIQEYEGRYSQLEDSVLLLENFDLTFHNKYKEHCT